METDKLWWIHVKIQTEAMILVPLLCQNHVKIVLWSKRNRFSKTHVDFRSWDGPSSHRNRFQEIGSILKFTYLVPILPIFHIVSKYVGIYSQTRKSASRSQVPSLIRINKQHRNIWVALQMTIWNQYSYLYLDQKWTIQKSLVAIGYRHESWVSNFT